METIAAGFGDDVDDAARFSAKFRVVGGLIDVHFLDVVHRRAQNQVVESLVRDGHAIDEVQVMPAALAQNSVGLPCLLQTPILACRPARCVTPGVNADQIDEIDAP